MSTAPRHDSAVVSSAAEVMEAACWGWGESSGAFTAGDAGLRVAAGGGGTLLDTAAAVTPVTPYLAVKSELNRLVTLLIRAEPSAAIWLAVAAVLLTRMDTPTTTEPGATEVTLT